MSDLAYLRPVSKPLRWLAGEVKTPPMGEDVRRELGFLLRRLQDGDSISLPHSRPMPSIGRACHELRVTDKNKIWRLIYALKADAIVILDVVGKKTEQTPKDVIDACKKRLHNYENHQKERKKNGLG